MNDTIKEILDFKEDADYKRISVDEITILRDYITNLQEENKRLNNIINELEKWLKDKIDNFDKDVKDTILHEQMTIRVIYDYLQELKGDSSNE